MYKRMQEVIRTMYESIDFVRHRRTQEVRLAAILPAVPTIERQTRLVNVGMYKRMEEMITDPGYEVFFNCEFDGTEVFFKRCKAFLVVAHCPLYKRMQEVRTDPATDGNCEFGNCEFDGTEVFVKRSMAFIAVSNGNHRRSFFQA